MAVFFQLIGQKSRKKVVSSPNRSCVEQECDRGLAHKLRTPLIVNILLNFGREITRCLMKSARAARPQIREP